MINATFSPNYEQCANVMADVCYGLDVDARTLRDLTIYFWNDCAAAHIDPETDAGFIIARSIRNGYLRGWKPNKKAGHRPRYFLCKCYPGLTF